VGQKEKRFNRLAEVEFLPYSTSSGDSKMAGICVDDIGHLSSVAIDFLMIS
jgi:hypothetical protein